MKHASELAEWDRHILVTRRSLLDLEDELKKVRRGLFGTGRETADGSATKPVAESETVSSGTQPPGPLKPVTAPGHLYVGSAGEQRAGGFGQKAGNA